MLVLLSFSYTFTGKNLNLRASIPSFCQTITRYLLDLIHFPMEQRMHAYAPSLLSADANGAVDRFFFDGALRLVDFPDPAP